MIFVRAMDARELFRQITKYYFQHANVVFSNQSRTAKPGLGLVVLTPGNVKRPYMPTYRQINGVMVGYYESRMSITIDLFTHGNPITEDGITVYENSAVDDMLSFADYINSDFVTRWCYLNDIAILIDGDAQDLTGVINERNYEYRARMNVMFYFLQYTVGDAAVARESSIRFPDFLADEDQILLHDVNEDELIDGELTEKFPVEMSNTTGGYITFADYVESLVDVNAEFKETSTGGGTEELANKETGYFTEAEIKEEDS